MGTVAYEREMEILRLLDVESSVSVTDLSALFGISPVTIRKDLETLERRRPAAPRARWRRPCGRQ